MLAQGMNYDEILEDYPKLTHDDILASFSHKVLKRTNFKTK